MGAKGWWTVVLTALAGPLGAYGAGLGMARWAEVTTGGMAVLAGAVVGIILGAPLAALIVFAMCLVTLMRGMPMRRWVALLIMVAAVIAQGIVMVIGLRMVGGASNPEIGLIVTAAATALVFGAGAWVALTASRRQPPATPADPGVRPGAAQAAD